MTKRRGRATTMTIALVMMLGCRERAAGPPRPIAPVALAPSSGQVRDLATDGTWVAWCEHARDGAPDERERVRAVPVAGGAAILVAHADCSSIAVRGGVVAWSVGSAIWSRPLPAGEARALDAGGGDDITDLAIDDAHVYAMRTHRLDRVPLGGGAPELVWSVPTGSVGDELALGHHAAWVSIRDDDTRAGDGMVGLHRVDTGGAAVGVVPVRGKRVQGLRVIGGSVLWIAAALGWEAAEAGGMPREISRERPDAIDGYGLYVNPRPVGRGPMRYQPRVYGWSFLVEGAAEHIAPLPDGFVASFPRIEEGDIPDLEAPAGPLRTRRGPVASQDHGTIGLVRWAR